MVLWVVGSILHGGPIQLFLIPGQCTINVVKKKKMWYMLSCLWDYAYKITLVANQKE